MTETRRVRFTDDYVPGPERCPVWGVEVQWTFGVPAFIRAETKEEAMNIFTEWCEEHPGEIESAMKDQIDAGEYNEALTSWYHARSDKCWEE